jgi:hypothetical protein
MEKCITNNEVVEGLMAYVTTIVFRHLRVEAFGLVINEYVSIPWVRRVDEEQISTR